MASSGNKDPIDNLMNKLRSLFGSSDQLKNKAGLPPKTRFSIWYALAAILLFSYLQQYYFSSKVETIPYSQFKQYIAEGKVVKLTIGPESINGTLKGNPEQGFTTIRVNDPGLVKEMDGFETNKGVIIMAATNRPEILDPALLRPGRLDRPDINGREAILKIHSKNVVFGPEVDLRKIVGRTPGFVGADLANIINEAALLAARNNKEMVEMVDFDEAIDRVVAGLQKKNRVINPKEKEIVAFHESGHAIVAESVEHADPVHKISIIPRGIAALGYTQQQPTENRYLMTRSELLDRLAVLLGDRVAEELVFKEISTGAQNDLQRATDIARSTVTEYGMSDSLGLVSYERPRQPMFLPDNFSSGKNYSEAKSAQIDQEVTRFIEEAHQRVRKILSERRTVLDDLAHLLSKNESVQGEELRKMLSDGDVQRATTERGGEGSGEHHF